MTLRYLQFFSYKVSKEGDFDFVHIGCNPFLEFEDDMEVYSKLVLIYWFLELHHFEDALKLAVSFNLSIKEFTEPERKVLEEIARNADRGEAISWFFNDEQVLHEKRTVENAIFSGLLINCIRIQRHLGNQPLLIKSSLLFVD